MTATTSVKLDRIEELLAEKGYEVAQQGEGILRISEPGSGIALQAALEGGILFFSLTCVTVPRMAITAELMRKMLDAANGISTSNFQLYDTGDGKTAITLNNFCKLQDLGADDEDDILACVHFLLVDVVEARRLIGGMVM
ncbi:MAG TPA: hypothetical protein VN442_20220 [Bryobacteraceae bacterium]|nr:hypothetical protein [Bryobacteraceae bacterium]